MILHCFADMGPWVLFLVPPKQKARTLDIWLIFTKAQSPILPCLFLVEIRSTPLSKKVQCFKFVLYMIKKNKVLSLASINPVVEWTYAHLAVIKAKLTNYPNPHVGKTMLYSCPLFFLPPNLGTCENYLWLQKNKLPDEIAFRILTLEVTLGNH